MQNPITLVTGGGRGIGRAIAIALAGEGARVAITARRSDEIDAVVQQITTAGGEAMAIVDNLADRAAPARIVGQVTKAWGPVAVLVNNVGVGSSQKALPLVEFDDDFWDLTMAVNVTAPYLLTKLVLPGMIDAGWGRIINISSINAKVPAMHATAYTTSKHALAGLTKSAAMELAGTGVTANAICPGVTVSEMNNRRLEYDVKRTGKTAAELEAAASPLGRRLVPEEIATLAVYLASDGSRAIQGQLINVCGGRVMA